MVLLDEPADRLAISCLPFKLGSDLQFLPERYLTAVVFTSPLRKSVSVWSLEISVFLPVTRTAQQISEYLLLGGVRRFCSGDSEEWDS